MELPTTIALAVLCLAATIFCGWRGALPPNPAKGPRMVPWRALMLLGAALEIVLIVRIASQLGILR
jgi:hypothetical protein